MRVLVADDETTGRLLVAAAVRKHGHEAVLAEAGDQAWDLYLEHQPDVVLTDRRMPGIDGIELVRRIRVEETDSGHHAYLVLVTALGSREQVLEGMEAGADDYLVKPVDPFDLQIRLIAAQRTTAVHRQLAETAADLKRANADLHRLARTDGLTEVGNRLRLDEDLGAIHARAARDGQPYAVALADVDHFKRYNDSQGHPAGDQALHAVATTLRAVCRVADRVYRYGGEEVAVLLPATGLDEAVRAAERLRAAVEELGIAHHEQPGDRDVLTVSVGVAALDPVGDQTPEDVLKQADLALYRAKADGRNRVATNGRA